MRYGLMYRMVKQAINSEIAYLNANSGVGFGGKEFISNCAKLEEAKHILSIVKTYEEQEKIGLL